MLNNSFGRLIVLSCLIFAAFGCQAGRAFGQHPCDAFVNVCTIPPLTSWTVVDTLQVSTGEPGEPATHSGWPTQPKETNWYHWQAPQSGTIVVHTTGTNPNALPPDYVNPFLLDTLLAAYTGSSLATLTRIDQSDDWVSATSSCNFQRTFPESVVSSCVMFPVTAGTTYHFQIDYLTYAPAAPNRDFLLSLYYRAPTAASVSLGGRVTDARGRALAKVRLVLTGADGRTLAATTNSFGFYRFEDLEAGQTVVLKAVGKNYRFQNNPRVLNPAGDVADEDFTVFDE